MKGYWSHTFRSFKHLVELYQAFLKEKGKMLKQTLHIKMVVITLILWGRHTWICRFFLFFMEILMTFSMARLIFQLRMRMIMSKIVSLYVLLMLVCLFYFIFNIFITLVFLFYFTFNIILFIFI